MRLRVRERHAGCEHQGRDLRPVQPAQILCLYSSRLRFGGLAAIVVKCDDIGAAVLQRAGSQNAGTTEAEDRDLPSGERRDGNHLNFSVASPASASTTATIQKRMTICGSVQPSCS